ncbi:MAG TPA: hypothetical protein VN441_17345 [Syntrophomonas sp.]|nr:hypothetical protein [Syntrophomonas sp.]
MRKRSWLKSIVAGALLGGLLLGSVGIVYAADNSSASTALDGVKSKLKSMLPGGQDKGPGMEGKRDIGINLDLEALVKDGIITSDESDAIQAKIDEMKAERQAAMDKIEGMTKEERQAYFESKQTDADQKAKKTDMLSSLVEDNIISSDTAAAIREAQQTQRREERQEKLTDKLAALVEDETITADQSDAIVAAMQEQQEKRQAEMEKIKAMSDEKREAYFKENKPATSGFLSELVTAGTITQDQADAVAKTIGGPGGEGKGHGGKGFGPGSNGCEKAASPSDTEQ